MKFYYQRSKDGWICFLCIIIFALGVLLIVSGNLEAENILGKLKKSVLLTAEKIQGLNLSLKEAMWYRKLASGEVQCQLCPLNCVIDEGKRGLCGIRANVGGKLRLLTFGKPVVLEIEPVEKQPFFHYLPGSQTLVVGTVGCNLRCKFCQNWVISQALPENVTPMNFSPEEVVKMAKENGCQSITFACTEPIVFYEYMYEIANAAKKNGLRVLLKTAAFVNPEPIKELCKYIDAVNIDIKSSQEEFYKKYCDGNLEPVLEATKIIKQSGKWVEISNLIIPGVNDSKQEIKDVTDWVIKNLGEETPIHFVRFIPNYKLADLPPTPFETLENAHNIASSLGAKFVYVVIVPGNKYEDTFCPVCNKLLIGRNGFEVNEFHIKNGHCEYCGAKIPGVFE